ncbi:L27 domain C-terminal [Trinorchestia longiramus]|nr:L27 domain C-terminal [Trinorchestia longiramus]
MHGTTIFFNHLAINPFHKYGIDVLCVFVIDPQPVAARERFVLTDTATATSDVTREGCVRALFLSLFILERTGGDGSSAARHADGGPSAEWVGGAAPQLGTPANVRCCSAEWVGGAASQLGTPANVRCCSAEWVGGATPQLGTPANVRCCSAEWGLNCVHPNSSLAHGVHPNSSLVDGVHPNSSLVDGIHPNSSLVDGVHPNSSLATFVQVNSAKKNMQPVMSNAEDIAIALMKEIHYKNIPSADAIELFALLQSPHLQGVLQAHDSISAKDFTPHLPEVPSEVDEDEETVKIVQLVKSHEPMVGAGGHVVALMGATIKQDEQTGAIIIARILHGGAADRSGLIHVGDEVHEVNGHYVVGSTPAHVLQILVSCSSSCGSLQLLQILMEAEGTITFKLVPAGSSAHLRESKVRVRAHFDYDPRQDKHIPCKEAGLSFERGDILHIVAQDDPYWWQARREGDRSMRAGLIPSRQLQERRISTQRAEARNRAKAKTVSCAPSSATKVKMVHYDAAESEDFDREEVATYEEVARLYPRPGLPRPVVLIGPPGVGRNELKRRLVALDPEKFRSPVPMTSRPPRAGEVNGRDYQFVTRDKLHELAEAGQLVEHGEYRGHMYGTPMEDIRTLINAGYVVVVNPHYQALKYLRCAELKPYVIFIEPPPLALLKESRAAAQAKSTFDADTERPFTEEELKKMLKSAQRIHHHYSHCFDEVIVNDVLSSAFTRLMDAIQRLESEPLWVPASWVQ